MKNIFYLFATIIILAEGCSTNVDLTGTYKDETIVYGLLSRNDDTTFIKINKAYLDAKTSALVTAKIPDSLYYKNLTVQLVNLTTGNSVNLVQADGNLEGRAKSSVNDLGQPGIFATAPNYLYQTTQKIVGSNQYELIIKNGENGKVITSTTNTIGDFSVVEPATYEPVAFYPSRNYVVHWKSAPNGMVYDLIARFFYREINATTLNDTVSQHADIYLFKGIVLQSTDSAQDEIIGVPGATFYNSINTLVPNNPGVYRVADSIQFIFSVAGAEYYNYVLVAEAQTGLTSGQVEPTYTNINNGLGLFSSRSTKTVTGLKFNGSTIDTLSCYSVTQHLNFRNHSGQPCN